MTEFKPSLKDRFWTFLKAGRLSYGESCFELRLSAISGNNWRTNYLIDRLRENATDTTEDEIGLALLHATNNGHSDTVRMMLDKNCGDTAFKQPQTTVQFCNAAAKKRYELAKKIEQMQQQENPQGQTSRPEQVKEENRWDTLTWKERSFCVAARNGDLESFQTFIENGVRIDTLDNYAICIAADAIHSEVFDAALKHGADITARNCEAFYPAIFYHATQMEPRILETAVTQDVQITKDQMESIINMAVQKDFLNFDTVEMLLNFAGKMDDKADVTSALKTKAVQQNAEISALFKTFQRNTATPPKKTNGFKR